jgi:hypothetical protein
MLQVAGESDESLEESYSTKNLSLRIWETLYESHRTWGEFLARVRDGGIIKSEEILWCVGLEEGYPEELVGNSPEGLSNWLNQSIHNICYSATINAEEDFTVNYEPDYTCLYVTQINSPGIPAPHCISRVSENRTAEVDYTKEFIDTNQICHIALNKLAEQFPYYLEFPSEAEVLVKGAAVRDFAFLKKFKEINEQILTTMKKERSFWK